MLIRLALLYNQRVPTALFVALHPLHCDLIVAHIAPTHARVQNGMDGAVAIARYLTYAAHIYIWRFGARQPDQRCRVAPPLQPAGPVDLIV